MADFLKVEDVINELNLAESMVVAEFGCGSAHFAITLAKKLKQGRVYALDIQEEKLSALKGKLSVEKITNVVSILCDLETPRGSTLPDNSLDVVLIPNVLFQVEDKSAIIKEAARVLNKGGRLLVIDWLKGSPFGPKTGIVTPEAAKEMAMSSGFSLVKEFVSGDYHFALIFTK